MFNYRSLERNVQRVTIPELVPGRTSGEWRAILPQGISTSKISECEGIRESTTQETERETGNETQVREDGRCWEVLTKVKVCGVDVNQDLEIWLTE